MRAFNHQKARKYALATLAVYAVLAAIAAAFALGGYTAGLVAMLAAFALYVYVITGCVYAE